MVEYYIGFSESRNFKSEVRQKVKKQGFIIEYTAMSSMGVFVLWHQVNSSIALMERGLGRGSRG